MNSLSLLFFMLALAGGLLSFPFLPFFPGLMLLPLALVFVRSGLLRALEIFGTFIIAVFPFVLLFRNVSMAAGVLSGFALFIFFSYLILERAIVARIGRALEGRGR